MNVLPDIAEGIDSLIAWRRELHRRPELGLEVPETARVVAERLRSFGVDQVIEGVGGHGVVGVIDQGEGPTVALRADMDALPILETSGLPYASEIPGRMHACGHDGHTTMLLGAARSLAQHRRFRGRAVLVFQPGEETLEGASAMLDDGVLDRFGIAVIYGMHNLPGGEVGTMRVPDGAALASSNRFTILVRGTGGHAALPQLCCNPIDVAAAIVVQLHQQFQRDASPGIALAITNVGAGAGVYNIIPDEARLDGSLRFLDPGVAQSVTAEMEKVVSAVAADQGVTADLVIEPLCPVTRNHPVQAAYARDVAGRLMGVAAVTEGDPLMASEDFAFFLEQRPGAFAFIANGDTAPLHNSSYDFNDEILGFGASYWVRLVEEGGGIR
jgi:hippurate hydrolase